MVSQEQACMLAALILNDAEVELSAENINKLLAAAGVTMDATWVELFAEYFKKNDLSEQIKNVCLGGAAPAATGAAAVNTEVKEEEKKEEEEVVEMAGGFDDLFG